MAAPEWSVVKKLSSSSMNVTPNEADHKSVLKLVRKHEPAIMDISGIRELWQLIPVHYHCWILLRSIKKVQTAEELLSLMNEIELEDRHKEAITRIYYAAKFVAHFSEQVTRDRVLCTNWVFNQLSRTKDELFTMNDAGPFKTLSGSGDFTEGAFTSFDRLVGLVVTLWEEREGYSDVEQQYLAQCASCVDLDRIAAYIRADGTAGEIIRSLDDLKKYCRQLAGKSCFTLMAQYASLIRNSETLFWMMQNYLAPSYHDEMANLYYASCFTRYFNFRSTGSREGGTIRVIQWMADKLPRDHDFIFTRSSETYPYPVPFCILLNKSGKDSFQSVDNAHDLVGLVLRLWKHRADLPKALREAVMLCDKLANLDNIMAFLPAIKMKHELEIMMQRIPLGYEESILDVQVAKLYNRLVVALTNGSVIELPYLLSTYRSLSLMLNAPLLVANDGVSPSFAELARLERYGVNISSHERTVNLARTHRPNIKMDRGFYQSHLFFLRIQSRTTVFTQTRVAINLDGNFSCIFERHD